MRPVWIALCASGLVLAGVVLARRAGRVVPATKRPLAARTSSSRGKAVARKKPGRKVAAKLKPSR